MEMAGYCHLLSDWFYGTWGQGVGLVTSVIVIVVVLGLCLPHQPFTSKQPSAL